MNLFNEDVRAQVASVISCSANCICDETSSSKRSVSSLGSLSPGMLGWLFLCFSENCSGEKVQGLRSMIGRYKIDRGMLRIV